MKRAVILGGFLACVALGLMSDAQARRQSTTAAPSMAATVSVAPSLLLEAPLAVSSHTAVETSDSTSGACDRRSLYTHAEAFRSTRSGLILAPHERPPPPLS